MIEPGEKIVIAFSGGSDSAALLHAVNSQREELRIQLSACHMNHKIRGDEAESDARFCEEVCEKLSIPLYSKAMDVPSIAEARGLNLEDAGRRARFTFYRRALRHFGADKIAAAHHMNDQAETVLMNFLRGSGERGLSGIAPVYDGWLIRPMIGIGKDEILKYLDDGNIQFVEDSSNRDTRYRRNELRLETLKELAQKYNPNLIPSLARTAELQRAAEEFSREETEIYFLRLADIGEGRVSIKLAKFNSLYIHIRRLLVRRAFEEVAGTAKRLSFDHVEQLIESAAENSSSFLIDAPFGVQFRIDEEKVIISRRKRIEAPRFRHRFQVPGEIRVDEIDRSWRCSLITADRFHGMYNIKDRLLGAFPAELLTGEITVRSREPGDRLQPIGMKGTKKLKDILIDKKIRRSIRDTLPVFERAGEIFWVPGVVVSEKYKVLDETDEILIFEEME